MNDDLRSRVMEVIDNLRGSSTGIMQGFDDAIENDEIISQEEFRANETEIFAIVDNNIFECAACGWTLNTDEMGKDSDGGELQCRDCNE